MLLRRMMMTVAQLPPAVPCILLRAEEEEVEAPEGSVLRRHSVWPSVEDSGGARWRRAAAPFLAAEEEVVKTWSK